MKMAEIEVAPYLQGRKSNLIQAMRPSDFIDTDSCSVYLI